MTLHDIIAQTTTFHAGEGDKIPWDDPAFSQRMLANHLSQDHDWASRRQSVIARQVDWIAGQLPPGASVLDLSCGPGFYLQPLARRGYRCTGVDFSPAAIAYARQQATAEASPPVYVQEDIRSYRSAEKFDCILMTFGEFNVFSRQDAAAILRQCAAMLHEQGLFLLEAHTHDAIRAIGQTPATWQRQLSGLFSETAHLCLQENSWDADAATASSRYTIIDAASAQVQQYSAFMQAYRDEEYRRMLSDAGLPATRILPDDAWPVGDDFRGKLQVFECQNLWNAL